MTMSLGNVLAEYEAVIPALGYEIVQEDPLTLVNDGFTVIVRDSQRDPASPDVVITIPGVRDVPVGINSLLAALQLTTYGGRFDTGIAGGNLSLDFVMRFTQPVTARDVLAITATARTYAESCEQIIQSFGGRLATHHDLSS